MKKSDLIVTIENKAKEMRKHAVNMTFNAGAEGGHLGPALSMIDICAALFFGVMHYDAKNPMWEERDRFVLSKGHGVLAYYAALAEAGFIPVEMLNTFEKKNSYLAGHPCTKGVTGIECSTGSMGHGLSIGLGMAMAAKLDKKDYSVYVVIGDGEQNEGMIWEAMMFAAQHKVDNLIAIVDKNGLQHDADCKEILDLEPLEEKWRDFGWEVREVDGHDVPQLINALDESARRKGKPYAVIAHTVKGKGVSFMENNNFWHHSVISQEQTKQAINDIENGFEIGGI